MKDSTLSPFQLLDTSIRLADRQHDVNFCNIPVQVSAIFKGERKMLAVYAVRKAGKKWYALDVRDIEYFPIKVDLDTPKDHVLFTLLNDMVTRPQMYAHILGEQATDPITP